jgi:hypothetical protein
MRWRLINVGALALLAGGALFISDHHPRTWISGHVIHCNISTKAAMQPCAPVANLTIRVASAHGSRYFAVVTDSTGAYAVDLVPGQYVIEFEYQLPGDPSKSVSGWGPDDWGGAPVTIHTNQHIVRDLRSYSLAT